MPAWQSSVKVLETSAEKKIVNKLKFEVMNRFLRGTLILMLNQVGFCHLVMILYSVVSESFSNTVSYPASCILCKVHIDISTDKWKFLEFIKSYHFKLTKVVLRVLYAVTFSNMLGNFLWRSLFLPKIMRKTHLYAFVSFAKVKTTSKIVLVISFSPRMSLVMDFVEQLEKFVIIVSIALLLFF